MPVCLVVDDNPTIRQVARRIVEGLGFTVHEAANGQEALIFCRKQLPDAITLDWNMPIMNGPYFLRELRMLPGGIKPKVIFCSTESNVFKVREVLDAGADEYVMKPFDADIIAGKFALVGLI